MELISTLQARVGADVVVSADEADLPRHLRDFAVTAAADVRPLGVAYPRTTEDVSAIVQTCHAAGVSVTPQGGLTGLVGGAVPTGSSLILSVERMRAIEEVDAASATMTVQAGVVLETAQQAADEAGLFLPLDVGGRGSAQIGGVASTNAGGVRVLRYGMTRQQVLGLEVVLADGTVITSLNKMLKNNTGYDLKQLFIGAEGTLGVITRIVLALQPKTHSVCTALLALQDYDAALDLLMRTRARFGAALTAFEVMWPDFYHVGTDALSRTPPIPHGAGLYVLIETRGADEEADQERFESVLSSVIEEGVADDAVIARSGRETEALWAVRDSVGEWSQVFAPQLNFDVSLPTGRIGPFRDACLDRLKARWPQLDALFFGHVADGNLHIAIRLDERAGQADEMDAVVYDLVGEWRGSISAEHGIGLHKRPYLGQSRTPDEIALMRTLKQALDPKGVLNPGKIF